jgi:hypothetical protein
MSSQYSAQGSITIKRLRNGDSLFLALELNGIPLYQGVDPTTGNVSPSWNSSTYQPIITPKVTSLLGNTVARSSSQWSYNGVTLLFTGALSSDKLWRTDSTGRFQINVTNGTASEGALKIIKNLAEADAVANGQLTYSCVATVGNTNYNISKSIDVIIQSIGASAYYGYITATTTILDSTNGATTLKAALLLNTLTVTSNVYVKWYKDSDYFKSGTSLDVTRDDVDGTQLFIAEFYILASGKTEPSSSDTPVARAGIYIVDSLDDFMINLAITTTNKEVTATNNVRVLATIINAKTNTTFSPSNVTWKLDVMDKDNWVSLRSRGTGNTETNDVANAILVTTAETDRDGNLNDVEVVAEASWA